MSMNVFRVLADVAHTLSKCILIYAIHRNKSSEGVSLITQALYALVFITRYLDLFEKYTWGLVWNFSLKLFYIFTSLYILFIMLRVYARTREREKAWKFGLGCLVGSAVMAPFVMMIFEKKDLWHFTEILWVFSIILESVCVLPQLLLLRQTSVPTVIDSFYLITLGSYRGLYILNWIWRGISPHGRGPEPIPIIFGVIQTAFYIDFFWVYYSRQRVKLRHGGIVDADDVQKGWILNKVFGNKRIVGNIDDEESAPALGGDGPAAPRAGSNWGSRGISVSADDGVLESESDRVFQEQEDGIVDTADAKMKDPDELARILEEDDDSDDGLTPNSGESSSGASAPVGNGSEWRDGSN